jgi:ribonuclease P protein subunit POP4
LGNIGFNGGDSEADFCIAIPKEHTVFKFTVPVPAEGGDQKQDDKALPLVFELHGNQFENRAVDRANKKFKWRNIDYI